MLVLGIDPGIARTGYGFVQERDGTLEAVAFGVISTTTKLRTPARLKKIHRDLSALVAEYTPASAALEKLFFSRNVSTAMSVGQARGVAMLALADYDLKISEYGPNEIKQAVAGYGKAGKAQIQEMVRLLLSLDEIPRPDDAADALAVAICHLHADKFQRLIDE